MNDKVREELERTATVLMAAFEWDGDVNDVVTHLAAARRKWRNEGIEAVQKALHSKTSATTEVLEWVDWIVARLLEKE